MITSLTAIVALVCVASCGGILSRSDKRDASATLPYHSTYASHISSGLEGRNATYSGTRDSVHKETGVHYGMDTGHREAIHSVVLEGKIGEHITKKINETFEYLIEFTYNVTELEVSRNELMLIEVFIWRIDYLVLISLAGLYYNIKLYFISSALHAYPISEDVKW